MNGFLISLLILISYFPDNYQSIHEQEWLKHQGEVITVPTPEKTIPLQRKERPLSKVVFGYYPYWMGTAYNYIQNDLLSHIAYFSIEMNGDGSLGSTPNPSIMETLRNLAHSNGVLLVITVTQFDDVIIENFLNSSTARTNGVVNLYNYVITNTLDGVSIDFEFSINAVKDSLTLFMTELTDSFHANIPGSHITIATPAVDWGNGFDYDQLALHSDGLFIMAYNYYWSGSSYAGPVSPLPSSNLWGTYSVMWTVNNYIQYGIYTDKFILGCPYYGFRWPTESSSIKSQTRGTGEALTYTTAADSAEVYGKLWDDTSKTVWYTNYITGDGWYQCWFDDSLSLRMKYQVVLDSNLCGAGIWALGYDGTKEELWGAIRDAFYYTGIKQPERRRERREERIKLTVSPNPFNTSTTITLNIPGAQEHKSTGAQAKNIELNFYDVSGRLVRSLSLFSPRSSPITSVSWDGRDKDGNLLPSGIYFCTLESGVYKESIKLHLLR
jgi:spore germination protein YaaH